MTSGASIKFEDSVLNYKGRFNCHCCDHTRYRKGDEKPIEVSIGDCG